MKHYLIKNPIVFQGTNYLTKEKQYFEGWYFKHSNFTETISFIPGINMNENNKSAFIQVITNNHSYFISYDLGLFHFNHDPFFIKIDQNYFSQEYIHIDINDRKQEIIINGNIQYHHHKLLKTNFLNPNIMGPFSYLPFMECNHAILSMKHRCIGNITVNDSSITFKNGIGYMEKDWGISFPKYYIWLQGNQFQNEKASFMISIANIPFTLFHFRGLICILVIDQKEYKFTTYNFTKIITYHIDHNSIHILLQKRQYILEIKADSDSDQILSAPVKGQMIKNINESISAKLTITLKQKNKIIFHDTSINCGLEIVD